jgi:hypothetical protein
MENPYQSPQESLDSSNEYSPFSSHLRLCIYGLIVYLNREASDAFQMGQSGRKPNEILAVFCV